MNTFLFFCTVGLICYIVLRRKRIKKKHKVKIERPDEEHEDHSDNDYEE